MAGFLLLRARPGKGLGLRRIIRQVIPYSLLDGQTLSRGALPAYLPQPVTHPVKPRAALGWGMGMEVWAALEPRLGEILRVRALPVHDQVNHAPGKHPFEPPQESEKGLLTRSPPAVPDDS